MPAYTLADEIARKKRLGIDRNYGKTTPQANQVGYLQRAYLPSESKKATGNGFTVANPNPSSNNNGFTQPMPSGNNNVGTNSVQQFNQNTTGAQFLDSDFYNGGGISSPFLSPNTNNTGGSQGGGSTGGAGQAQPMTFTNDYLKKANELMTQLETIMNKGFSYDYQSDPTYLAAVEAAKQGAKKASSSTLETMSDRGILNSSVTSNQLAQIEQEAQQAPLQLIPQLENNAYNRYANQLNSTSSLMSTMLGAGQQQQSFESNERYNEAEVTGTYESPEMRQMLNTLVELKTAYGQAKTPQERATINADANRIRANMKSLGMSDVDKLFGGGVTIDQALANFSQGGIQTVASKHYADETSYRTGRDKVTDDHWQQDYNIRLADSLKPTGGGSGDGMPTFDQMLKGNTNRMLTIMLSEIGSPAEIPAWIKANSQDLLDAGVDPNSLSKSAKAFLDGGGDEAPKPETPQEVYDKAVAAAQQDPGWPKAKTEEEQQAIIAKWHKRYKDMNADPNQPKKDPVDTLFNFFKPFIPAKYGGSKKSPNSPAPRPAGHTTTTGRRMER